MPCPDWLNLRGRLEALVWVPMLFGLFAQAAEPAPVANTQPDPSRCRVIVEDLGNVGIRISDAQALAAETVQGLRQRVGQDGVAFAGLLKSHMQLKKMLGANAETQIQEEQIAYLKACMQRAPFRVRIRFGKSQGKHFIVSTCNEVTSNQPSDQVRFEGATFAEARDRFEAGLATFCPALSPPAEPPTALSPADLVFEGAPTNSPPSSFVPAPKAKRAWSLPPRRD